jgi:hypothetical protein
LRLKIARYKILALYEYFSLRHLSNLLFVFLYLCEAECRPTEGFRLYYSFTIEAKKQSSFNQTNDAYKNQNINFSCIKISKALANVYLAEAALIN